MPAPPAAPDLDEALEAAVLGASRRYTRGEVADAAGLQIEEGTRLWRSLGFPEAPDDAVLFNDRDLDAAKLWRASATRASSTRTCARPSPARRRSRCHGWPSGRSAC
jgi:adenylate cyclase